MSKTLKKSLALAGLAILALSAYLAFRSFEVRSAESLGPADAGALFGVMESYKSSFSEYPDKEKLNHSGALAFEGHSTDFYLSPRDLPEKYRALIDKDDLPFVSTDSFRALISEKNAVTGKTQFWTVTDKKVLKKLDLNAN